MPVHVDSNGQTSKVRKLVYITDNFDLGLFNKWQYEQPFALSRKLNRTGS